MAVQDFELVMDVIARLPNGTSIPKPQSNESSKIFGWGRRRGEKALVYAMPNHKTPEKPHKKGITITEFKLAYDVLLSTGKFTRAWFEIHMPECNNEGGCNFTSIGGVFELVGVAEYVARGGYQRR
ncbi:MAG: hypothetical protein P1V21_17160 [Rhizobiaceae bacterium]|nr:hypothetical protein [Rhizobiaceae bacterium]